MQLNKKLIPIVVLAATSSVSLSLNAASSDEISFRQMKYSEGDDRIDIDYSVLDFKKDFGADYTFSFSASYDAISGGTPIWDSISGASSTVTSDASSGASSCVDEYGNYLCKDTRSDNILGDGYSNMDDFAYRNVQIEDTRKSVNVSLTKRTEKRDEISIGTAYSKEEDFKSLEGSFSYLYNIDSSRNSSITAGISYQLNSAHHYLDNKWKDFNIINTQIGYTHTFSKYTIGQINYYYIRQSGVLSNPYQTIIRKINVSLDDTDYYKYYRSKEKRPEEKNSAGMTLELVSKIHEDVSWHGDYRFYRDDWGITSHTIATSFFIDLGNGFTLNPLLRYYKQSAAVFYKAHNSVDFTFNDADYGSADERLSSFDSMAYSLGLEKKFTKSLSANISYAQESQSFGLDLKWVSLGLNYTF